MTGPERAIAVTGLPPGVLAEHLDYLRMLGRSENTIKQRRRIIVRLARALPCPVLDAGPGELLAWRAVVAGDASVRPYISHVRQFYAWAVDQGLIAGENPARRLPVPRGGRRLPRPIGEDDLMDAIAAAPDRIRLWLVLAAWCGLRAKEIAYLRRECILLDAKPVPLLLVAWDATKGRSERVVPLSPFVVEEIKSARLPLSGWCFRRHDGQRGPNKPAMISGLASRYFRSCGIPATLHMLRHRFGTQTYVHSRDLRAVQELLGHASPATTQIYADWDRASAAAAVAALATPPRLRVVGGTSGTAPARRAQ